METKAPRAHKRCDVALRPGLDSEKELNRETSPLLKRSPEFVVGGDVSPGTKKRDRTSNSLCKCVAKYS